MWRDILTSGFSGTSLFEEKRVSLVTSQGPHPSSLSACFSFLSGLLPLPLGSRVSTVLTSFIGANTRYVTARSMLPDTQSPGHVEQRDAKLKPHPVLPTAALCLGNVLLDIGLE